MSEEIEEKKSSDVVERPRRNNNFVIFNILFVVFVGGCFLIRAVMNFAFPVVTSEEVAKRHFESPEVSQMEHLSGVGWSVMQAREQKVSFTSHRPVRLRNAKDFNLLTSNDAGFKYSFDDIVYAFPEEKSRLLADMNALEIWRHDPMTLLHDKNTDLYLFLKDD
jgi:hypothetical protein